MSENKTITLPVSGRARAYDTDVDEQEHNGWHSLSASQMAFATTAMVCHAVEELAQILRLVDGLQQRVMDIKCRLGLMARMEDD